MGKVRRRKSSRKVKKVVYIFDAMRFALCPMPKGRPNFFVDDPEALREVPPFFKYLITYA